VATALTIAGSDSGGGAGIQADLKTFARCGVHGACAVTAVTAQNTLRVVAIHPVPPAIVLAQIRAVVEDIGVDAIKIGMLGDGAVAEAVALAIDELPPDVPVVLDPVLSSSTGAPLLDARALEVLRSRLLPRALVITPNIEEARLRAGAALDGAESGGVALVGALHDLGARCVVLTGGHGGTADEDTGAGGPAVIVDLFYDGAEIVELRGERYEAAASHGSGCTHSAALAAMLARGSGLLEAARGAREITAEAVRSGLRGVGAGTGPVDVLGIGASGPREGRERHA
jgi:hydroxymethylpyrimidine/phosphomethylpyrimidine kinase